MVIFEIDTKTLSVASFENQTQPFSVFPNPANQQIVYFNRTANVEVFDLNGRKVFSTEEPFSMEKTLNLQGLQSGMYIVKLVGEGLTYSEKVVLN